MPPAAFLVAARGSRFVCIALVDLHGAPLLQLRLVLAPARERPITPVLVIIGVFGALGVGGALGRGALGGGALSTYIVCEGALGCGRPSKCRLLLFVRLQLDLRSFCSDI